MTNEQSLSDVSVHVSDSSAGHRRAEWARGDGRDRSPRSVWK
jgi:hypothetical protein